MKHATVTAYRPSANEIIEMANYILVNILRTIVENNRAIWNEMLPMATQAYNTAYHRVIRDSPYYLLHLRDPNIPHEMLEAERRSWYIVDQYKQEPKRYTKDAPHILRKNAKKWRRIIKRLPRLNS